MLRTTLSPWMGAQSGSVNQASVAVEEMIGNISSVNHSVEKMAGSFDELEKNAVDRIGLALTRFAAEVTRPVSSLSPLESLATDACVEPRETARVAVLDLLTVPLLLSLLAAVVMPRKEEDS